MRVAPLPRALALAALCFALVPAAQAGEHATREDATALVRRGIAAIRAQGPAAAYAAISQARGPFTLAELYLVVYALDGRCLAHGADARLIGRDMSELTDVDGRYFVKERIALARSQPGGFWQDYKFRHPVSGRVEDKSMYCERLGDTAVCGGVYR